MRAMMQNFPNFGKWLYNMHTKRDGLWRVKRKEQTYVSKVSAQYNPVRGVRECG